MNGQWFLLENTFQHYPWGSTNGIPSLLGLENPEQVPMAELWMGAHDSAPSSIITTAGPVPLNDAIAKDPDYLLGTACRERFGDSLPYLFKVLSAAHPLSIQAHPGKARAREGFERENRRGIPVSAPKRNYRDPNHKPEIILALSPFTALCGFRPVEETARFIRETGSRNLLSSIATLESNGDYRVFLKELWSLSESVKQKILEDISGLLDDIPPASLSVADRHPLSAVRLLAEEYPGDIGILSPLYLNTITLKYGEALYLPEGVLHAYLSGTGLELMANSDNVLRGGLTRKHIDIPELLAIITPDPHTPEMLEPVSDSSFSRYPSPAEEFALSLIQPDNEQLLIDFRAPTILLVTHGNLAIRGTRGESDILQRGTSIFIPARSGPLTISGEGIGYVATVPTGEDQVP